MCVISSALQENQNLKVVVIIACTTKQPRKIQENRYLTMCKLTIEIHKVKEERTKEENRRNRKNIACAKCSMLL
jgi:hypothetical protein